jgi:hypothetical protein
MTDQLKVTNYFPDCDSITLEVGDYHVAVYLDGEHDRQTHVDIHNKKTSSTKYLIVGAPSEPKESRNDEEEEEPPMFV